MTYTIKTVLLLIAACMIAVSASAQYQVLTASEIIQRSINNYGGDKTLDSLTCMESSSLLIQANGDTLSCIVKKKGFNKCYVGLLGKSHGNSITIFNESKAAFIQSELVQYITNPVKLEELKLQSFISLDYGYKKLGYKFRKINDQRFSDFDCYVVLVTSPLGKTTTNYYDKRTGNLIVIMHPNGNKSVFIDYFITSGISSAWEELKIDSSFTTATSSVTQLNYDEIKDDHWFKIPAARSYVPPAVFKEGKFKYDGNDSTIITRTKTQQLEGAGAGTLGFKVLWNSATEYILYDEKANLTNWPDSPYIKVRIVGWLGKKYYCQYISSHNKGGTCAFIKLD